MDGMNNALFTVDNEGKVSYVNNSFAKLTGYIPDEIMKKDIKILFIPTDLHNINDLGDDIDKLQTQIISKDFDLFPVEISVRPFSIENKTGRIFTAIDMRDRIEIEKRQVEMQKMRSDFNSMIVHDLKNPLSIIMGFAEMLESQTIGDLNQKQTDFVAKIVDSSEQLLKLTNEILEISKFESGKMPLKIQELDISDLINQIVQTQQLSFKKKDISFIEKKIDFPVLKGDVDKLNRLFTNLIINALKFSKQKGTISIHYDFTTRNKNQNFIIVEVQDTGVGIPKKDLPAIFSKYKQAENRAKISEKGTGLGLAICKMIVEAHKGKISVKSEGGLGTSFFVELPIEEIP